MSGATPDRSAPGTGPEPVSRPILSARGLTRSFPGVQALRGVDLDLHRGEAHAVLGENGAGKSTLMKILGGVLPPDEGSLELEGAAVTFRDPDSAARMGIVTIHQELALVDRLTIAQNVSLGREPTRQTLLGPCLDSARMRQIAHDALARMGVTLDPGREVSTLGVAQKQLVEIARALSREARVLILDEPTAALSGAESLALFRVMEELKSRGVAMAFISHRLDDIYHVCDRITVLRDGQRVHCGPLAELPREALVSLMVGREAPDRSRECPADRIDPGGHEILKVEGLTRAGVFENVTFSIRAGEIVGMAGLIGAGRTEVARSLIGEVPADSGRILMEGVEVSPREPRVALAAGMAYLPEDRKGQGLVLSLPVRENVGLTRVARQSPLSSRQPELLSDLAAGAVRDLRIKTPSLDVLVKTLSGGNQQKVLMGRNLSTHPRLLICDEPTRGIDVGARAEIYDIIRSLASQGKAILLISSDLPEVLELSDRILVMCSGKVTAEITREEATPERVMERAVPRTSVEVGVP